MWKAVASPKQELSYPGTAISAASSTDAWLVAGTFRAPGLDKNLIEHWDGEGWTVAVAARGNGDLRDVSAVSSSLAWAVGATDDAGYGDAQILGWDGLRWKPVPTTPVGDHSELDGVDAVGSDEAWAVGWSTSGNNTTPLIEHWNGAGWKVVPNPTIVGRYLRAVSIQAGGDVWAVGFKYTNNYANTETLVEHWDGTAWAVVASPNPGRNNNSFSGVEAVAADDVWAVGYDFDPSTYIVAMAQHWDGTEWSVVDLPTLVAQGLNDVAAVTADDVWAVGGYPGNVVIHWDGSSWKQITAPSPSDDDVLTSVVALPTGEVWASGIDDHDSQISVHPITLHLCEG